MKGGEATITWVAVALIGLTLVDFFVVKRWIRFDRTPAGWMRLFVHDFAIYALLVFALIKIISASAEADFLQIVMNWDWLITFANIIIAILFRWFLTGKFRRPADKGETGGQPGSSPDTK